jgi:hypothetical protein
MASGTGRVWELSARAEADAAAWEIMITPETLSAPETIEHLLPSTLRGSADPADTPPLVLRTHLDHPAVIGFHIEKASPWGRSQALAAFDVRVNGALHHRKNWPWAERADGVVDQLFYVPVPAGESRVTLEVHGGYRPSMVEISRYYIGYAPEDLPSGALALPADAPAQLENIPFEGYQGIWYEQEQPGPYGDKYSGGLGTYTSNHLPLAVYAEEVDTTFFVYGGTLPMDSVTATGKRVPWQHASMIGSFDHATGRVSRPTVVHETRGSNDPHFNPALSIDAEGYLLVFVSGRAFGRPGHIYRSIQPYCTKAFERIHSATMNYPQPWLMPDNSLLLVLTQYTQGRTVYLKTNPDGRGADWTAPRQILRMGGHYAISGLHGNVLGMAANYHIGGSPDRRTNLYYLQTGDGGENWATADGTPLTPPLTDPHSPARVIDYESQGLFVYLMDLAFDENGHPVMLYVTTRGHEAGPPNDPRTWRLTRWNGTEFITTNITTSDHNYDVASLYLEDETWRIIGPSRSGPQAGQTGGEIDLWTSSDRGWTWTRSRQLTAESEYNHTYVRRPLHAQDPFYAFWADGDPTAPSPSRLYFSNREGRIWRLPTQMKDDWANPEPWPAPQTSR